MAALSTCYASFEQQHTKETTSNRRSMGSCYTYFVAIVAFLTAALVKSWAILFGICAIISLVSFVVGLILRVISGFNNPVPRQCGSPLTAIFQLLFAAYCKCFYPWPLDMNELYINMLLFKEGLLPHTKGLRATIIKTELALEQQERKRWSLCKVTEIAETKVFIRTIPIWMTFIICGVVSSLGAKYFLEQAKRWEPKVGKMKAPFMLFFRFYDHFGKSFTTAFSPIFSKNLQYIPRIGISAAMMYATLSCITAAKVETRRLGIVENHRLIEKLDDIVPMNIFWLLPQFAWLGYLDGIQRLSAYAFSLDQAHKSMIKYFNLFARAFFGLGVLGSFVSVYVVGRITKRSIGTDWFQTIMNTRSLDNYYWVLACIRCYKSRDLYSGGMLLSLFPIDGRATTSRLYG